MNKKLTLSIDEAVVKAAKDYAQKNGTSLSNMVENFFRNATQPIEDNRNKPDNSSKTPLMNKIKMLRKNIRTPKEQEKYQQSLYDQKPDLKELISVIEKKHGRSH